MNRQQSQSLRGLADAFEASDIDCPVLAARDVDGIDDISFDGLVHRYGIYEPFGPDAYGPEAHNRIGRLFKAKEDQRPTKTEIVAAMRFAASCWSEIAATTPLKYRQRAKAGAA